MKPLVFFAMLVNFAGNNCFSQIFASSLDTIPAGWNGPVFALHTAYPKKISKEKNRPWLQYNFKTQPEQYMQAVLRYFLAGNTANGFDVKNNKTRKWYHAPSMSWQPANRAFGREFIHGLTRERNSPARELYPTQSGMVQNWAVGFYNATGAYTFGKVWADTNNLQTGSAVFPEGTVTAKLLFTAARPEEVPYINGSLEWQANIHTALFGSAKRKPQTVRLLQIDIAVKDARANTFTGWVFGTFAYHASANGNTVWKKLVPVGLMWGNDSSKFDGQRLKETWINPAYIALFTFPDGKRMHLGYKGRLNGPVDNPASSCLSCHATAQSPQFRPITPDTGKPADLSVFFRNVKSSESFDGLPGSISMDYSLQLAGGVAAALANRASGTPSMQPDAGNIKRLEYFITSMEDSSNTPQPMPAVPGSAGNDKAYMYNRRLPAKKYAAWLIGCWAVVPVLVAIRIFKK